MLCTSCDFSSIHGPSSPPTGPNLKGVIPWREQVLATSRVGRFNSIVFYMKVFEIWARPQDGHLAIPETGDHVMLGYPKNHRN